MVTGHRPERLGDKATSAAMWLDEQLRELKPDIAITGMADGVDTIFAELAMKQHIPFVAALPWKKRWEDYTQYYQDLLRAAKEVIYACDEYSKECFFIRDKIMVDAADMVLAVWDGKQWGGTWETIEYALSQGKEVRFFSWYTAEDEEQPYVGGLKWTRWLADLRLKAARADKYYK